MQSSSLHRKKIFVVDDNPDNLGVVAGHLKNAGYKVAVAPNGKVALQRIASIEPVLVLLDVKMPGMDGFEVCRKMKIMEQIKDIPVVFLTALNDSESITQGFAAGASDYISKPVNKGELLARVKTHVENYLYKNRLKQEVALRTTELEKTNFLLTDEIQHHKDTEKELLLKVFYDSLTGLPNRQLFNERLAHAIDKANRNKVLIGVLLFDIDEFKNVNDSLGHHCGDRVLQDIASRISKCIRKSDTLARLGGDEFLLLIEAFQDLDKLSLVANNIITDFMTPYTIEGTEFHLGVSVGVAVYPEAGITPEELLKNADLAMYESKRRGKNRYSIFAPHLNEQAQRRITLDRDIRHSLTNDKFEVFYQPKVLLDDDRIYGMEALVRGRNDDGSIIPPGEFIPFAEANGLIVPIDLLVLRKACKQTSQWIREGFGELTVSVNISTRHFRRDDFIEQVKDILQETGLHPSCLELEVTETSMMKNFAQAVSYLKTLSNMGIAISLDDFGTGYSSLNYLNSLPIQTLKIDKSFIDHICEDHSSTIELVKIIILFTKVLNIGVIAEGVETKAQKRLLQDIGCERGQGYLFAKPLPHDQFHDLLLESGVWFF